LEYETRILSSIFWTEHGYRRDSFFFFASSLTSIQFVTWREGTKLKSDLPHDIYFLSKGYSSIFILLSIIPFLLKFIHMINWVPFNFIWMRIYKNSKVKKKRSYCSLFDGYTFYFCRDSDSFFVVYIVWVVSTSKHQVVFLAWTIIPRISLINEPNDPQPLQLLSLINTHLEHVTPRVKKVVPLVVFQVVYLVQVYQQRFCEMFEFNNLLNSLPDRFAHLVAVLQG